MKSIVKPTILAVALAIGTLTLAPGAANAGCLSGAAVGGVAGHFAGHHGLVGAGIGCLVGRHRDRQAYRSYNYTNGYGSSYDRGYSGYGR